MWNPLAALPPPNAFSITSQPQAGGVPAPTASGQGGGSRFNWASLDKFKIPSFGQRNGHERRAGFGTNGGMEDFRRRPGGGALAGFAPDQQVTAPGFAVGEPTPGLAAPSWLGETQYTPSQWDAFAQDRPNAAKRLMGMPQVPTSGGFASMFGGNSYGRGGFG